MSWTCWQRGLPRMRRAAGIGKESDSDLRAAGASPCGPRPTAWTEGGGWRPGPGLLQGEGPASPPGWSQQSRFRLAVPCSRPPFRPLRLLPLLPWLQRWWRDLCSLKTDQSSSLSLTSPASAPDLEFSPEQTETNPLPATCRLDVSSLHRSVHCGREEGRMRA